MNCLIGALRLVAILVGALFVLAGFGSRSMEAGPIIMGAIVILVAVKVGRKKKRVSTSTASTSSYGYDRGNSCNHDYQFLRIDKFDHPDGDKIRSKCRRCGDIKTTIG